MTRAVLVTVGTGGLGAAVTNRFLEDGHNVVAASKLGGTSETATGSLTHFGEQLYLLQADVTEWDSVVKLVERTVARVGTIEVLIHLVEGGAGGQPLQDVSLETWERMCAVNLRSAFLCSGAVLPIMRQQGWGRIVFVSSKPARSGRGIRAPTRSRRAGVAVLAETIAEEYKDLDVTANVVTPSVLDTPASRTAMPGTEHASMVSVEDVAKTFAFLAFQEAGQLRGAWLPAFGRA